MRRDGKNTIYEARAATCGEQCFTLASFPFLSTILTNWLIFWLEVLPRHLPDTSCQVDYILRPKTVLHGSNNINWILNLARQPISCDTRVYRRKLIIQRIGSRQRRVQGFDRNRITVFIGSDRYNL